ICNFIIALGKVNQALTDLILCGTRCQADKRIGIIATVVVQLGWKIIGFRFTFLSDEGCLFIVMVYMVWKRPHVIKKLRVNGPALVFIPKTGTDQFTFQFVNGILQ